MCWSRIDCLDVVVDDMETSDTETAGRTMGRSMGGERYTCTTFGSSDCADVRPCLTWSDM